MFPIELNQGGNYLIIRLCLTRPGRERRGEPGRGERGEGRKKGRGEEGEEEGEEEEGGRNIEIKATQTGRERGARGNKGTN